MADLTLEKIRSAYLKACRADVDAIKPGNVSRQVAGHGMTAALFDQSAAVTADVLVDQQLSLGAAIHKAAEQTYQRVGCNTNLGILLLCIPIAHAAIACDTSSDLQDAIKQVIAGANIADTQAVFDAIALMSPAGLGDSQQHDVRASAEADLLTVMRYAAQHDRIAYQYANCYEDILTLGNKTFLRIVRESDSPDAQMLNEATVRVFFEFLSAFPDSHIVRKHGAYMGEVVRDEALSKKDSFNSLSSKAAKYAWLLQYDKELKTRGINPGTSADMTVATLFASLLSI